MAGKPISAFALDEYVYGVFSVPLATRVPSASASDPVPAPLNASLITNVPLPPATVVTWTASVTSVQTNPPEHGFGTTATIGTLKRASTTTSCRTGASTVTTCAAAGAMDSPKRTSADATYLAVH